MNPYSVLKISGPDVANFLQGQLTCDVQQVTAKSSLAAHCNPQGRVIGLFKIFFRSDSYFLMMPADMLSIASSVLKKYAVFFKVELQESNEQDLLMMDHCTELQQGIPQVYAATSEKFLPHELNLPELSAINFNKGCYTGQEIIARIHYRGKLKKHLYYAEIEGFESIAPGTEVYQKQSHDILNCGMIVDACCHKDKHCHVLIVVEDMAINNDLFLQQKPTVFFKNIRLAR